MKKAKMLDYYAHLEADIIEEIEAVIGDLVDDDAMKLHDIQVPSTIVFLAAVAAAQVIVAFERGYQANVSES